MTVEGGHSGQYIVDKLVWSAIHVLVCMEWVVLGSCWEEQDTLRITSLSSHNILTLIWNYSM